MGGGGGGVGRRSVRIKAFLIINYSRMITVMIGQFFYLIRNFDWTQFYVNYY